MQWFRRNIRLGSWPAPFALGLQLVLSFGHIHAEDLRPTTVTTLIAQNSGEPGTQPRHDDDGVGHDFCAICAAVALTSSSVLPAAPLLAAPVESYRVWVIELRNAEHSSELYLNFQVRIRPRRWC